MESDYTEVTELAGDRVTQEQIQRMYTRYHFARQYCRGKDVLELGCGSGQGLGYLGKVANKVVGGDCSAPLLQLTKKHYEGTIPLIRLDAQVLPFRDQSFDIALLYEAIYYLKDPDSFVKGCMRVLRPGGKVLMCNPNKDLPDFNPSPHSYRYFSPFDFVALLKPFGLTIECFGDCEVDYSNPKQKTLSLIKKTLVKSHLMPKTMAGKRFLKRIVFGKLVPIPGELREGNNTCQLPCSIDSSSVNSSHKVIFAVAEKPA
jgi:ubiquinone/menaquinone biosynthesis C-methylase UbiE